MAKATGNLLITCQYLNTLSKVSFVAFQNLLSDKTGIHQVCLQFLKAAIVDSKGLTGVLPLLKKYSQRSQPSKTDFLLNTIICNLESFSSMLQRVASELSESMEKISEDVFNLLMKSALEFLSNVKQIEDCKHNLLNVNYPKMVQTLAILKKLKLILNAERRAGCERVDVVFRAQYFLSARSSNRVKRDHQCFSLSSETFQRTNRSSGSIR
jgi:hypothetical protein